MSREVIIRIRDDLDRSDADETISFAYRGTNYEIDLSSANVELFDKSIGQFVEVARIVEVAKPIEAPSTKAPITPAVRKQRKEIRAWANANGFDVSERGQLAASVIETYRAANPWVEILPGTITVYPKRKSDTVPVAAQDAEQGLISAAELLTKHHDASDRTARDPEGNPLSKQQREIIRVWANENGFYQPMTGQIKAEVLDAYWSAKTKGAKSGR